MRLVEDSSRHIWRKKAIPSNTNNTRGREFWTTYLDLERVETEVEETTIGEILRNRAVLDIEGEDCLNKRTTEKILGLQSERRTHYGQEAFATGYYTDYIQRDLPETKKFVYLSLG